MLRAQGVQLSASGDRLCLRGPVGSLTPALRATIDAHRSMLRRLLQPSSLPGVVPPERERASYPLSRSQRQLWFEQQLYPRSGHYNVPVAIRVGRARTGAAGAPEAIDQALHRIVSRHAALRTRVAIRDDQPVMDLAPERRAFVMTVVDLPASASDAVLQLAVRAFARHPFDLRTDPLFRGCLLRRGHLDAVLVICIHHIVADGWSMGILMEDFQRAYAAFAAGSPPAAREGASVSYGDFSVWQADAERRTPLAPLVDEARARLHDIPPLALPYDFQHPAVPTHRGAVCTASCSASDLDQLSQVARRCGSTLFGVFSAAYVVMLSHEAGQTRFPIGSDVAGRDDPAWEDVVGHFVNQIVMAVDLSGNPTLEDIIARATAAFLEAHASRELPFDVLAKTLRQSSGRAPLFHAKIVMQRPLRHFLRDLGCDILNVEHGTCKVDLLLNIWQSNEGGGVALEYSQDVFTEMTGARLLRHLLQVLEWTRAGDLSLRLADLDARLSGSERVRSRPLVPPRRRELEPCS